MGSSNIEYRLPKSKFPTSDDVKKWYKEAVEEATVEYGRDPYNGTISTTKGIVINMSQFTDYNTASDYVCDNTEKYGPVMAVTLKVDGKEFWVIGGWVVS